MCSSNTEIESKEYFLLRCHFCSSQRLELFENINILFYGYSSNNPFSSIQDIIKLEINFFIKSGRFDRPYIYSSFCFVK